MGWWGGSERIFNWNENWNIKQTGDFCAAPTPPMLTLWLPGSQDSRELEPGQGEDSEGLLSEPGSVAQPTSILQLGYNFTPVIFIYLNNLNILSTMRENRKIIDLLQKYLLVIFSLNTYLQYDGKCNFDIFYFEKYLQFYNKIPHCLWSSLSYHQTSVSGVSCLHKTFFKILQVLTFDILGTEPSPL